MTRALINVPKTARKGQIVEVKAMIGHPMETGHRAGPNGTDIPRDIINRFTCTYNGEEVFSADFFPAVSANPFVSFSIVATVSGTVGFTWVDDKGVTQTASADIAVS